MVGKNYSVRKNNEKGKAKIRMRDMLGRVRVFNE